MSKLIKLSRYAKKKLLTELLQLPHTYHQNRYPPTPSPTSSPTRTPPPSQSAAASAPPRPPRSSSPGRYPSQVKIKRLTYIYLARTQIVTQQSLIKTSWLDIQARQIYLFLFQRGLSDTELRQRRLASTHQSRSL